MLRIVFSALILVMTYESSAWAQVREPGGTAADADMAINSPDEYAWQLFLFLHRQASDGTAGVADPSKSITQFDPDKPVVWESWALASGAGSSQTGSEVYKPNGEKPGEWKDLPRASAVAAAKLFSVPTKSLLSPRASTRGGPSVLVAPLDPLGQEVRMNEATFNFVRDNELYHVGGLEAQRDLARSSSNPNLVQFPKAAKEVKAQWERLDMTKENEEKARFHWRKVGNDVYKLAALHIITKDLPNWFWADFVHVDYEHANGASLPSRDKTTRASPGSPNPPAKGSQEGERRELTGSKWANYRLRGTQINFVDARGTPVILGNGEIETAFPDQSSCMACHARATIGPMNGNRITTLSGGEDGNVQSPNPALFVKNGGIEFLQNDFVWSAPLRAKRKP
jgi:hypothetical protein